MCPIPVYSCDRTVTLTPCVCMYVCMCVCMCVHAAEGKVQLVEAGAGTVLLDMLKHHMAHEGVSQAACITLQHIVVALSGGACGITVHSCPDP